MMFEIGILTIKLCEQENGEVFARDRAKLSFARSMKNMEDNH